MNYRYRDDQRDTDPSLIVVIVFVILLLCSCQTFEAITDAPVEFWMTLEILLDALWADVLTVVDLLL